MAGRVKCPPSLRSSPAFESSAAIAGLFINAIEEEELPESCRSRATIEQMEQFLDESSTALIGQLLHGHVRTVADGFSCRFQRVIRQGCPAAEA
jgi:hypothetical protein